MRRLAQLLVALAVLGVAAPARANITYVGSSQLLTGFSTLSLPAGLQNGDVLVMVATGNMGTPTGWTLKSSNTYYRLLWRRIVGGETSVTATTSVAASILAFRGVVASGDPFDVFGPVSSTATASGSALWATAGDWALFGVTITVDDSMFCEGPYGDILSATGPATTATGLSSNDGSGMCWGYAARVFYGADKPTGSLSDGTATWYHQGETALLSSQIFTLKPASYTPASPASTAQPIIIVN